MIVGMVPWLYLSFAMTRVGRGMVTCMGRNSQAWEASEPLGRLPYISYTHALAGWFEERRTEEQNFWLYLRP